jgi:DNA-binding CsgD family transcriptional regulator
MTIDVAPRLQAIREVLASGRIAFAIELGRELHRDLIDPADLAVLHFLVGRAEVFNGRVAPATQRFRLADHPGLSAPDRLRLGIFEAFVRYQSGGVSAVEEVLDELDANIGGDLSTEASLKGMRAWTMLERGDAVGGTKLAVEAKADAATNGDDEQIVLSWLLLSIAYFASGNMDDAGRSSALGIEHAKRSGHGLGLPLLHVSAADCDLRRGRLAHAARHAREAIESIEPMSAGLIGAWGHGVLSILADRCGDERAAADHLLSAERALLRGAPLGWGHLAVARLRVDRYRDPHGAAQRLFDVWQYMEEAGSSGYLIMFCLPVAELSERLGDVPLVAEFSRRLDAISAGSPVEHLIVNLAKSIFHRDIAAAVEAAEAIEQCKATELTVVADSFALVANLLDREGDRRARSFAMMALEAFEKMGAVGDARRLVERHPALAPPDDRTLSPAEQRVVALLVEGKSNADIASELVLSIKTVESHLARVYRRFGVKSRTQLVTHLRQRSI